MAKSNITAYQTETDEFQMYYGKVTLGKGYYIVNADESFYHFVGANSCFSLLELLHPEDQEDFLDAVEKMSQEPQCLIAKLRGSTNHYHCMYMVLALNGRIMDDFPSFTIEMCNIMTITRRYKQYTKLVNKYREFMSLFSGRFFEYEFGSGVFRMYEYSQGRSQTVYQTKLEETYQKVQEGSAFTQEQKTEFQLLYEALKRGRDHFKTCIDGELLDEKNQGIRYEFKFSTLYAESKQDMVVGLVTALGEKQPKISYYLSENAFDPGTGLLNKRAIHEYAIDKIQMKPESLYLAIVDVDDFKHINDTFGHLFGDEALGKVAEIIKSVLKGRGVAGRFGGDEFMIVFEKVEDEDTLRRILSTIAKHLQWAFGEVEGMKISLSVGVVEYPKDGTTYDELFYKADKSLYLAKEKGKNRYIIYRDKLHGGVLWEDIQGTEVGLKATISDEKKHEIVSELLLQLAREGESALEEVMKQMQIYFDIDGVALYAGEDLHRVKAVGKYVHPIENLSYTKEEPYLSFYDEQGCYTESMLKRLENKCPIAYKQHVRQETLKFMHCAKMEQGVPVQIVAFDFFNRAPKLGTTDIGLIRILGRIIAQMKM